MRIGLIAYRYHATVLKMYLELLDAGGYEVVLFTSSQLQHEMEQFFAPKPVPAKRVVLSEGRQDTEFLALISHISASVDALLFVELQFSSRAAWQQLRHESFDCPIYCGVHDILHELGLRWIPPWQPKERSAAREQREVFARYAGYVVHSPWIRDRLAPLAAPRKVCFLPVSFRDRVFRRSAANTGGPLSVCVPGGLTNVRRDYDLALQAVMQANSLGAHVTLVLAGCPGRQGGQIVLSRAKAANDTHPGTVTWSEQYIEEPRFRQILERADIVLAPLVSRPSFLRSHFRGQDPRRIYAIDTHITAAAYDAIRFQVPIIYPIFYADRSRLHPGAATYQSQDDLARLLCRLDQDRQALADLTGQMIDYAASFTPERYLDDFAQLVRR